MYRVEFMPEAEDDRALYTYVRGDPGTIAVHLAKHRREVYKEYRGADRSRACSRGAERKE
jgi:hypothetical protein